MIKNRSELLSHGFIKGREKALDIAEHALQHVDPLAAVKRYVHLDGHMLQVEGLRAPHVALDAVLAVEVDLDARMRLRVAAGAGGEQLVSRL